MRRIVIVHVTYTLAAWLAATTLGLVVCYLLAVVQPSPFIDATPGWVSANFLANLPVVVLVSSVLGVIIGQAGFLVWARRRE